MTTRLWTTVVMGMLVLAPSVFTQTAAPAEWFQWRGPNRDGISQETGLLQAWPKAGPALVWRAHRGRQRLLVVFVVWRPPLHARARGRNEYVMAFDRATGQKALGVPQRPALRERSWRWPAQHADRRGRSALRARRQRRSHVPRERHRQEDLVGQPDSEVWRAKSLLGLQRIAADRRRPHPGERRRPARVDCRDCQGRRRHAVAEPRRRSRLLVADADAHRQPQPGDLLHRRRARWRSIRATGACCGRTTRWPTAPPTSPRRSCAAPACSCRRTTAPAPRCSTSAPPATWRRPTRSTSPATCGTTTPARC